jgi:asparagine synthase (glutamine-hydrolysing)
VIGAQLSSGFDSSAVAATAARLLDPCGGRVIAFTAVPRNDYRGPCPNNRLGDEGPLAATTAAMYPNMEHVLVRSGHLSPLRDLDRASLLFERPLQNLCNFNWMHAIYQSAREQCKCELHRL